MKSQQIDNKLTKQVRIDVGLHQLLKIKAARRSMSIKELLEGYIAEFITTEDKE